MPKLAEKLKLSEKRKEIISACVKLLDSEVARKGGLGGFAIKAGYKVLKAIKPGAVTDAIDFLLDDFVAALEPFHGRFYEQSDSGTFGASIKSQQQPVAEALLGVTDRRADTSKHTTLKKAYHSLRPSALRHVEEAVLGLADLIDDFYR